VNGRRFRALAAPLLALQVSACTSPSGWDGPATETALRASLDEAYPGAEVSVSCEDTVEAGDRCTATIGSLEIELVLADAADDVTYEFVDEVVATTDIAALLAEQLGTELGGDPAVSCTPAPLVVPERGGEVRCRATTDGRTHEVVAEFVDETGAVRVAAIHPGS
jgi:hypothetical protein